MTEFIQYSSAFFSYIHTNPLRSFRILKIGANLDCVLKGLRCLLTVPAATSKGILIYSVKHLAYCILW